MRKISVLGVGNILLQDEGFGVHVINKLLEQYSFPPDVQVLDGGTMGMELPPFLHGTEKIIIVDAITGSGCPGELREFRNSEVKVYFKEKVSVHEVGIQEVLNVLEITQQPINDVLIVGAYPQCIELGLEMTDKVSQAVPKAVDAVIEQLKTWQVTVE